MKKQFILLAVLCASALTAIAATASDDGGYSQFAAQFFNKKVAKSTNHITLLFIQSAQSGTMTIDQQHPGCATLTLYNIPRGMEYFTDQPHRVAGRLTSKAFVDMWQGQKNPQQFAPNVAIQADIPIQSGANQAYTQVASLRNPQLNSSNHSLSYLACPLKGKSLSVQSSLKNVTVFYDNFVTFFKQWPP